MSHTPPEPRSPLCGFTLMEMMLVMLITSLLIGVIFGIVTAVTQLTESLATEQRSDSRRHGLAELLQRTFRGLPPHAIVRLHTRQHGTAYRSEITLVDAPPVWAGSSGRISVLETVETRGGYLQLVLRVLTPEEALKREEGQPAGTAVVLMDELTSVEWRCYDRGTDQWLTLWNSALQLTPILQQLITNPDAQVTIAAEPAAPLQPNQSGQPTTAPITPGNESDIRRPSLLELTLTRANEPKQRWVFWTPPLQQKTTPAPTAQPQMPRKTTPAGY